MDNEIVHTRSIMKFGFWDRIQILLGRKLHHDVDVELIGVPMDFAKPLVTTVKYERVWFEPFIVSKRGGFAPYYDPRFTETLKARLQRGGKQGNGLGGLDG